MAQAVVMPKAGISVESCIIGHWKKQPGDSVELGEALFDYETDKASFECESTAAGTLLEVFFGDGEEVPVLTAVCAVGQLGEEVASLRPDKAAPAGDDQADQPLPCPAVPQVLVDSTPVTQGITPRAKALAASIQVDSALATPTGPRGRILERDIQALAGSVNAVSSPNAVPGEVAPAERGYIDQPMSGIRKTIAQAMHRSLRETAQLTHHHSFDATALLELRSRFKADGELMGLKNVTVGDLVLFAVSRTLADHPALNAHLLEGNTLRRWQGVHLGVAVDTDRGLMVPTLFDADRKSLTQISGAVRELAELARSGSINPDLLHGATFTVSNLGALGVEVFTPILNPPQVGILGVCGIVTRVREKNGAVVPYPAMGLSLTYDHRAVDGAPASRFARDLCRNLENIQLLLAM